MKAHILFSLLMLWAFGTSSQIRINELCPKNHYSWIDENGDSPDWLEIRNVSDSIVDLSAFCLSDDQEDLCKSVLPNVSLHPGELFLFIANGETGYHDGVFCLDFRLSSQGECVFLSRNGIVMQEVCFPAMLADHSYGAAEGSENDFVLFRAPTPAQDNAGSGYAKYCEIPDPNAKSGFYSEGFELSVQNVLPDEKIWFSMDGKDPLVYGELFAEPLYLDSTQVFRMISSGEHCLESEIIRRSYLFRENNDLPVISLFVEPDSLWDEENGMFMMGPDADTVYPYYGANFWKDKYTQAWIEYFEEDAEPGFQQGFKMEVHGGSVTRTRPQKALRFIANKRFGGKVLEYALFEQKDIDEYRHFILRNSGGDFNKLHFRDAFVHQIILESDIDVDVLAYEPVSVYLNGSYWGVMNLREKVDKYYLSSNYDISDAGLNLLEEDSMTIEGDWEYFNQCHDFVSEEDMTDEENFKTASSYFDIESLTDYFICEAFFNNTDWPNNNLKFWQSDEYSTRWRYILFDMDPTLNNYGWANETENHLKRVFHEFGESNPHVQIILSLLENESYRTYFLNRYADLMNTTLSSDQMLELLDRMIYRIEPEMQFHFDKWGGNSVDYWHNYHIPLAERFIINRPEYARQHLEEIFNLDGHYQLELQTIPEGAGRFDLNTVSITDSKWSGYYFKDVSVSIKAEAFPGFLFSYFELSDGRMFSEDSIQLEANESVAVQAVYKPEGNENLILYPNPCQDYVYVSSVLKGNEELTISLLDLSGRLFHVFKDKVDESGLFVRKLDVSDCPSGYYTVSLVANGQVYSESLFVSRP